MVFQLLAGCTGRPADSSVPQSTQVISFGQSPDHPTLRSSKDPWEPSGITAVTVYAGDRIEIRPEKLIHQERLIQAPVTVRTSEKVCVKSIQVCVSSEPIFTPKCTQKCRVCEDCNLFGCHFKTCCSNSCENVHTGDRCTNMETRCAAEEVHWQDESLYSGLGDSRPKDDLSPMKSVSQITEGIRIKLEPLDFATGSQPVECALNQFQPSVSADMLSFTLGNVPGCPGLFPDPGAGKALTLINQMSATINYLEGRLIQTHDGRTLEQPKNQTYDVPIDFVGSFSITSVNTR